jgi:hypothetical protein
MKQLDLLEWPARKSRTSRLDTRGSLYQTRIVLQDDLCIKGEHYNDHNHSRRDVLLLLLVPPLHVRIAPIVYRRDVIDKVKNTFEVLVRSGKE